MLRSCRGKREGNEREALVIKVGNLKISCSCSSVVTRSEGASVTLYKYEVTFEVLVRVVGVE